MGIPIFNKTSNKIQPLTHGVNNSKTDFNGKKHGVPRLALRTSTAQNFIEIEFPPCCETFYILILLFLLWFPLVLYIIQTHSAMTAQLHDQHSKVDLLKVEVQELLFEVGVLKRHLNSAFPAAHISAHSDDDTLVKRPLPYLQRQKRSDSQDIQTNMRRPAPSQRKTMAKITPRRGIQAIHYKGAHPEAVVEAGRVGPWYVDSKAVVDNEASSSFQLREDGESVEIKVPGLYLIYAQVYYLTTQELNSFSILLLPKETETPIPIALCSTSISSAGSTSEVSCYTAAIRSLQSGDRVYVQQREKHRRLIMRGGHTFLGFAKLSTTS